MSCVHFAPDTEIATFAALQEECRNEPARHANEVRLIARLRTHDQRGEYLQRARQHRGAELVEKLRSDVWALMRDAGKNPEGKQEGLFA